MRQANIGDGGVVSGCLVTPGSGMAQLLIKDATAPDTFLYIAGDWRPISQIAEELDGQEVVVVASEGSSYGCHAVRPVVF